MRIARYTAGDRETVGIVIDDRVIEVEALGVAADAVAILSGGPTEWQRLEAAASALDGAPLASVRLLAPIPRPPKFLAIGMNSQDHVEEAKNAPRSADLHEIFHAVKHTRLGFPNPRFPMVFNKQSSAVTGPDGDIWIPHDCPQVDYEGEAALVIGARVRRANETEAAAAIAGWMVHNDVTVREWQWNTSQIWLGKSFQTHAPIGPWIVTADAFDQAHAAIRTWVNGELRQDGRLADQLRSPAQIVSELSQLCTLEPGDVIATGTPAGVGTMQGKYLKAGDRVRIEVTGIGAIENHVVDEPLVDSPAAA